MTSANEVLKLIKDRDIKYVDFRFYGSAWQVAACDV